MKKFGIKQVIPLLSAAVGVLFLVISVTQYGFWDEIKGPTKGFFPTIIAIGLILGSILAFVQSFKEEDAVYPKANFLVILAGFGIYALTSIIGLLPALLLYLVLWLKLVEKTPWKTTAILSVSVMAVVIGVFGLWLDIQFPAGIIYDHFFG